MQRFLTLTAFAALCGCAGSSAHTSGAAHASADTAKPAASAPEGAQLPEAATSGQDEPPPAASEPGTADALPERVEAGEIPRSALVAVLSSGVGRFLQKVKAEPHLEGGRFVGWRLVSVFDGSERVRVLKAGDTVLSVNGQGIERPEQFKDVWDKVAARDELVLLVQREGRRSELHYRIVQQ
jgi:type II secretory pathway component PulC